MNQRILSRALIALALVAGIAVLGTSCSSKADPAKDAAILHSDSDGIPDHIETQLGTDPNHFDSDHDGLSDYYELVEMPKRAAERSGQSLRLFPGEQLAYAAETGAVKEIDPEAWKSIDLKSPHDSDGDGVHDALDPYASDITVTLTADLVGRIHSAITKSEKWDWKVVVPTPDQYNDAFIALMKDEESTPAPLIADDQSESVAGPDLKSPLTQRAAIDAWTGLTYGAKIPVWKLDDIDHGGDEDGIPIGYETYGYSWDGSRFVPWGFTLEGKSSYTPATVGFEVVGTTLTPTPQGDRDYSIQYFRTDPGQLSSDGDPYSDKLESIRSNIPQTVRGPSDRPVIAAYPTIVGYMDSANVTLSENITTTNGKSITKGTASGSVSAGSVFPKVPVTGLLMGSARPSTGAVARGLNFVDKEAVSVAFGVLTDNPTVAASFPSTDLNLKFNMKTNDWSQATSVKTDAAAVLDFEAVFTNTGFANANQVKPTVDVMIGRDVVRSVKLADPIAELPAQGTHSVHVNDVVLSLEQLKSYQSGAPVSLRVNQVEAEIMVPQRDGGTTTYKDAGTWTPFASAIDNWCAKITVDMGNGTFATYPVMAKVSTGNPVTLLDALIWSMGVYDAGSFQGLDVPGFLPGKGSTQAVPSFADWLFSFDENYTEADVAKYDSIFDMPLVPRSHIYVRSPMSDGDTPAVSWASISSASGPTDDVTDADGKLVAAAVNADMAVGKVWLAPSATADKAQWTALTDKDTDGVFTATLPASWRVIAGQAVVVAESATVWGDGTKEPAQVMTPAVTTGYTGLAGSLSATIKSFPGGDVGVSKDIIGFDFDTPTARVIGHGDRGKPPAGTDLGMWLYSNLNQSYVPPGDVIKTISYTSWAQTYKTASEPKWMGKSSSWATKSLSKSLPAVKKAKREGSWKKLSGGWDLEFGNAEKFAKGDTFLLETAEKRWVKCTITEVTYDSNYVSDAGTAYALKTVKVAYTTYDPGQ